MARQVMKKGRILFLWAIATVMIVMPLVGIMFYAFQGRQITRANYALITKGMARTEVEKLLGGPPGNYAFGPGVCPQAYLSPKAKCWMNDELAIIVEFDGDEKTVSKHVSGVLVGGEPANPSFGDRMRGILPKLSP